MRITGKVKWFNDHRGFGFITPDDGSRDVFVHRRAIAGSGGGGRRRLEDGQRVEYELQQDGDRGPAAANVSVIR